jgi:hypothetical protein
MRRSQHPFRDSVVKQAASRHRGLQVTVFAPKHGPRFRAYVHTPGWERVLAVSAAESADAAMRRAEALLTQALGAGVEVHLPAARRPLRLRSAEDASA